MGIYEEVHTATKCVYNEFGYLKQGTLVLEDACSVNAITLVAHHISTQLLFTLTQNLTNNLNLRRPTSRAIRNPLQIRYNLSTSQASKKSWVPNPFPCLYKKDIVDFVPSDTFPRQVVKSSSLNKV